MNDYSNLDWQTWHMLTGLGPGAYKDWLKLRPAVRHEVVDIMQCPEEIEIIRERLNDNAS